MLNFVPPGHPLNKVAPYLVDQLRKAQSATLGRNYAAASELFREAVAGLRIDIRTPDYLADKPVEALANKSGKQLREACYRIMVEQGVPLQAADAHASSLAQRVQLLLAFPDPDYAVNFATEKVAAVASRFPRNAADIERGRNPGDVLDPYILAATQYLLYSGDFSKAINATVAHKALMMVEGLLGHLHEDLVGLMRGNVRAPEPRGRKQEGIDFETNPFPGADVVQPPLHLRDVPRFHQLKS